MFPSRSKVQNPLMYEKAFLCQTIQWSFNGSHTILKYFWPIGKVQRYKPHPQSSCTFEKSFWGVKEICSKGSYSLGKVHTIQTELHLHLNSCLPEKVKLSNISKNLAAELLFLLSCIINHSLGRCRGPDTPNYHQRAGCITSRCTWTHRKHYNQRPISSYYLHPCQRR